MFENVGEKIKKFAKVFTWIDIIGSFIGGIVYIVLFATTAKPVYGGSYLYESKLLIIGIVLMIVGPFVAWFGGLIICGFGELVINTREIRNGSVGNENTNDKKQSLNTAKLEDMLRRGLITKEEFDRAMGKQ